MKNSILALPLIIMTICPALKPQEAPHYPPLKEYMMTQQEEIALAKSAAPAAISDHATITSSNLQESADSSASG